MSQIDDAVAVLKNGGLVIYPTETTYGVGVDATNQLAVNKLAQYKKRPLGKPYSIAVCDLEMAQKYVEVNPTALNLYKTLLPGPLTVISKSLHKVARGVESETGTLGIRIPDHPLVLELVKKLGLPITATSANASYQKRPYKITDILENLSDKQKRLIDLIIDAGELPHNEPSTVIDTTLDDPVVLRQGEIKLTNKNEVLSRSEENTQNLGKELVQKYESYLGKRPIIFALSGPMGAGKTQFTKGVAKALGITETVVSPTFNLVLEYKGLVHFDAWRIENAKDFEALGINKYLTDKSVIAIEWAERVQDVIRSYHDEAIIIWVKIEYGKNPNDRLISRGTL